MENKCNVRVYIPGSGVIDYSNYTILSHGSTSLLLLDPDGKKKHIILGSAVAEITYLE